MVDCSITYQLDPYSQLCISNNGNEEGVCNGDSGGPINTLWTDSNKRNLNWYVVGLTSYGYKCGRGAVFTKTSYFYNWIKNVILK